MLKKILPLAGIICIYFVLFYYYNFTCPFLALAGIPCPTCGITRGFISLLKGDIAASLNYNPLSILAPVVLCLIFLKKSKTRNAMLITIALLFFIVYIINLGGRYGQ